MKTIILLLITSTYLIFSAEYSSLTKSKLNQFLGKSQKKYNSLQMNGVDYIPVFAKINTNLANIDGLKLKYKVGSVANGFASFYLKRDNIKEFLNEECIISFEISDYSSEPHIGSALNDVYGQYVNEGIDLPKGYTGKGVIVGIIDGGFDFTHPNFYDSTLQNYRVIAAWDQRTPGNPPDGYEIGTAWYGKDELLSAGRDTEEIQENWGTHGTHVAGIAGGSGGGTTLRGVAYECEFIFLTKIQGDAGLFDAFNWMKEVADAEGKRLVINMSFGGLHHGTRDGSSSIGEHMNTLAEEGVVFVGSAGNNGGNRFHIKKDFNEDTLRTWVRQTNFSDWGNRVVAIGETGKHFGVSLESRPNTNFQEVEALTEMIFTNDERSEIDSFMVSGADTVYYRIIIEDEDPDSKRTRIDIFIKNITNKFVTLKSYAEEGIVHYWSVVEAYDRTTNRGGEFSKIGTLEGFTAGDAEYGVGEPGLNDAVITVAAHSHYNNELTNFSSEGPRIDETIKPDISAPGFQVVSSIAKFVKDRYQTTTSVLFNDEEYTFAALSGTSMSAPLTAGVVALILEADPEITTAEIKSLIKATAYQDQFTGEIPEEGSVEWGAGKLDAYGAILDLLGIIKSAEFDTENNIVLYPNPSVDNINVLGASKNFEYEIYDIHGNIKLSGISDGEIMITELVAGVYFIKINNQSSLKFVKE